MPHAPRTPPSNSRPHTTRGEVGNHLVGSSIRPHTTHRNGLATPKIAFYDIPQQSTAGIRNGEASSLQSAIGQDVTNDAWEQVCRKQKQAEPDLRHAFAEILWRLNAGCAAQNAIDCQRRSAIWKGPTAGTFKLHHGVHVFPTCPTVLTTMPKFRVGNSNAANAAMHFRVFI